MIEIPDPGRTSLSEIAQEALAVPDGDKLVKYYTG
jgi:hypothetical protein